MHLLKGQARGLEGAAEPVDLQQTPGAIVILTAADTEISGLAAARRALPPDFPAVRIANWMALAHPYSVDLYSETVLAHAKLVVIRLLGGASYWRYGLDEAVRVARTNGSKLAVLSGDAIWDEALSAEGAVPPDDARTLWSYFVEGGSENLANALRFAAHLIGEGGRPPPAAPLPSAGVYAVPSGADLSPGGRGKGQREASLRETAAVVFYRSLLQAGQTESVDVFCAALAQRGLSPLPLYVSSLKGPEDATFVAAAFAEHRPAIVLNATAFALSQPGEIFAGTVLDGNERPVLQVTFAGGSEEAWVESSRGLSPADLTMNVVMPEIDGRIVTRAVSFKQAGELDPLTECRPVRYRPKPDRIRFVADLAARWAALRGKTNAEKRVAIVLSNYPNRDGRLANGVGLDAPASTVNLLKALREAGYRLDGAPESGADLMSMLLAGPTNVRKAEADASSPGTGEVESERSEEPGKGGRVASPSESDSHPRGFASRPRPSRERKGGVALSLADYCSAFRQLPKNVQGQVLDRWGSPERDPFISGDHFLLPAHHFGNIVIAVQPARGYNIDPKATYHDPDLVPPHGYFAFYVWLREMFGADALVHMGKHGNLEWLPGKALALSESCYPEATLGPLPVVYPFIINDPGEGAQAKRRSAAVVVDHLMPPMARAESYGPAAELEALIDEYAAAQAADQRRAALVSRQIMELAQAHGFDADLGLDMREGEAALAKLDEHICDLKELQIRDGLHVLGDSPTGDQRTSTLVALARAPRGRGERDASILRALAADLDLGFDPLDCRFSEPWHGPRPDALAHSLPPCGGGPGRGDTHPHQLDNVAGPAPWRTYGDTVERLEKLALRLIEERVPSPLAGEGGLRREPKIGRGGLAHHSSAPPLPPLAQAQGAPSPAGGEGDGVLPHRPGVRAAAVLAALENEIAPALDACGRREIAGVLDALNGKFVPPGPSGAPTRGRPDCLPTGRNFYSVDVRAVPTPAAWELGRRSADLLAARYFQDEGEWPKAMALTVWGTSNMRTGGDDIAQALALIGARPVWEGAAGRVTGVEIMPLSELKRPRVDVTLRISGFFRDAFPTQIALFHEAVQAVAERDEPADANPLAARIRADAARLAAAGLGADDARRAASFRIFGSKPGAYGAGLQALIDEGIWAERKDLAAAFLEWSAYAYGGGAEGRGARELLETRLKATDAVVQNQDNREHDLLDSDDYYQFEGGLAASVQTLRGRAPKVFHNDHSRPERPVIRALDEEIARIVRGRAANPKWIAGMMRHGYKGAFEMAATVDYLFAFAATTDAVRHHHFDQLYDAYLGDEKVRGFIAANNPPALEEIAQRFREAVDRGLWAPRKNSAYEELRAMAELEVRGTAEGRSPPLPGRERPTRRRRAGEGL